MPAFGTRSQESRTKKSVRASVQQGLIEDAKGDEECLALPSVWSGITIPRVSHVQRRSDGRWFRISERQTEDGGTVAGLYGHFRNSKRREQEAEEANRAKSQFLANMSHEPEDAAQCGDRHHRRCSKKMPRSSARKTSSEPLERISRAGKHLLNLINEILDLSKIEAGKLEFHLEDFDILSLVRDVATTVQPLADKNGNQLVVRCPDDLGGMRADLTRTRQIVLNLLSNACKSHGKRGGLCRRQDRGRRNRRANDPRSVRYRHRHDTGADGKNCSRSSVRPTARSYPPGSVGPVWGLRSAGRLARMMGGDIEVTSEPGEGSTFKTWLPPHGGAQRAYCRRPTGRDAGGRTSADRPRYW